MKHVSRHHAEVHLISAANVLVNMQGMPEAHHLDQLITAMDELHKSEFILNCLIEAHSLASKREIDVHCEPIPLLLPFED